MKCKRCKYQTANFDRIRELTIDIEKGKTVVQLLKHWCKPLKLEDYICNGCKDKNCVWK